MSGDNPFAQWGGDHTSVSPSSVYGALPLGFTPTSPFSPHSGYPSASPVSPIANSTISTQLQIMSFQFMSTSKSVLNSAVVGADGKKYFTVATHAIGNSIITKEGSTEVAGAIEWQRRPVVTLSDVVARQSANQWLILSQDKRYRTMAIRGQSYSWVPSAGMICLYTAGYNPSEFVARIVRGRDGGVSLDVTSKAVHGGLLEVCVLAAVLFTSGRNLD